MRRGFRTIVSFLRKWTRLPDDYETLYQEMVHETQQLDSMSSWDVITAWGINPPKKKTAPTSE